MRSTEEIKGIIETARSLGLASVAVDGVTFHIPTTPTITATVPAEVDVESAFKDVMAMDELSDDEILYWSTSWYDFLQEQKQEKHKKLAEEKELKNG